MELENGIYHPPGSPVYIGDRPATEMELSIITYNSASAQMINLSGIDELIQHRDNSKMAWINVSGLKDIDSIKRIGELYSLHPLTIEDVLHTEQQPKMEMFDNYRFLSIKTIRREKNFSHKQEKKSGGFFKLPGKKKTQDTEDEFLIDQVSVIIMKKVLITFQEIPDDPFAGIRKRILENIGDIRKKGMDYLAYLLIDAAVDEYFLTLNHLEEDIGNFEEHATKTSDSTFIEEIQDTKKYLLQIKRAISPLKDNLSAISHQEWFLQADDFKPFMQDLRENLNHAITTIENYREWLSNIMDVNLSVLSHQTNKVMKVLAMISTIFIPLTFVAGIYGMNFVHMPELEHQFAYPIVLGVMGAIAVTMVIVFKFYRWF
jgi:magnesium transporter